MTITIIILAYVASVFLNRWLNKIVYKNNYGGNIPLSWFFPLFTTFVLLHLILTGVFNSDNKVIKWFTGKHWKP